MHNILGDLQARSVPSAEVFRKEYLEKSRPVVFENAVVGWPAQSLWTEDWLRARLPHEPTDSDEFPRQHNADVGKLPGVEREHYPFPKFVFWEALSRTEVWFGPAGTRSGLHYDSTYNLFAQLEGKKRFQLYHPRLIPQFQPYITFPLFGICALEEWDLYPTESETVRIRRKPVPVDDVIAQYTIKPTHDFVLEAGEMLFIPYRWIHRVTSLERQRSISLRWVSPTMALHRAPVVAASSMAAYVKKRAGSLFRLAHLGADD